jgi:hypothetical protein
MSDDRKSIACKDCKRCLDIGSASEFVGRYLCESPRLDEFTERSDHTGQPMRLITSQACRDLKALCGQSAAWFEARQPARRSITQTMNFGSAPVDSKTMKQIAGAMRQIGPA